MGWIRIKRPFNLIIIFIIMALGVAALFRWTPPNLLTARLSLLGESDWPQGVDVLQTANVSPGRATWLFFVNSKLGERATVQQYLHYYPETAVAAANWEKNRQTLINNPDYTLIPLPEQANSNQQLLCQELSNRISCEYRAQADNWTIHADFTSRDPQLLSLADIMALSQQLGERLIQFLL